jgi:hypothetical protein
LSSTLAIHRALVTSSRSSRGTQRGTVRGSIGWLKHRNLASSGQSQIGGLPIGVKLEGRLRIPSAILGGGGIEIRSRSASRDPSGRRAQTGQSRRAFSDAGPRVRILLPPAASLLRTGWRLARKTIIESTFEVEDSNPRSRCRVEARRAPTIIPCQRSRTAPDPQQRARRRWLRQPAGPRACRARASEPQ